MAPFITSFNNLSKAITYSIIKVRCVHLFQGLPDDKSDNSLECVLHDSKGSRIQATFPTGLVQNFGCRLKEGRIFCIKNFFVRPNTLKNKTTNHQFRLLMNVKTEIVEVNDNRFLRCMYDFKSFTEISQIENVDDTSFFDVIGVITGPGRVITQSKYRLIEIEIEDENHNKLFCTIWDSNVDLYLTELKKNEGTIPIVIVQFCKRNLFKGEIRVSTHFQASKVVINADVEEVKQFRSRIKDDVTFLNLAPVNQQGQIIGGEYDDLQVKSLEDLACLEEGSYWVFGKIESVECHYNEWFYLACKLCMKKVRQVDNKYNCTGCHKTYSYAVRRYRFIVNVVDHTSNASLLLWDREGILLLGRNVADLIGDGGQDFPNNSIPHQIESAVVGQKYLFKLQLKNHIEYYKSYPFTVNKVCTIPEVIERYTPKDMGEQIFEYDVKLSDLFFGNDLAEVSQKSPALSTLMNENVNDWSVEDSEFHYGVGVDEVSQNPFVTPDLSTATKGKALQWVAEGSVKRCLDLEFEECDGDDDDVSGVPSKKKEKVGGVDGF